MSVSEMRGSELGCLEVFFLVFLSFSKKCNNMAARLCRTKK